jgi:Kef-type K+ transport system membrane component KefB
LFCKNFWQMCVMSECTFSETDVSTALTVSFAILDEFVLLLLHAARETSRNAASVSVNAFLFIITPLWLFWVISMCFSQCTSHPSNDRYSSTYFSAETFQL